MPTRFKAIPLLIVLSVLGLLATIALAILSTPADAQGRSISYSWTNATARTDGSAFNAATDQAAVEIAWGTSSGGPYENVARSSGAATSYALALPPELTCGTVYAVATTVAKDGTRSAPTSEVAKLIGACAPNPPGNFAAQ